MFFKSVEVIFNEIDLLFLGFVIGFTHFIHKIGLFQFDVRNKRIFSQVTKLISSSNFVSLVVFCQKVLNSEIGFVRKTVRIALAYKKTPFD